MKPEGQVRIPSGCAIAAVISKDGTRMTGRKIIDAMKPVPLWKSRWDRVQSLVVGGSIRSASDVVKAIALGADACNVATAALLAMGCHLCRTCQSGKCNWGIATQRPDLVKRLNPNIGSQRLVNLMTAWNHEIKELMGGWVSTLLKHSVATD